MQVPKQYQNKVEEIEYNQPDNNYFIWLKDGYISTFSECQVIGCEKEEIKEMLKTIVKRSDIK